MAEDILAIFGTFLLSIEAIKLKNFVAIRETILKRCSSIINPQINWVDDEIPKRDKKSNLVWTAILLIAILILGLTTNYVIYSKFPFIHIQFENISKKVFKTVLALMMSFFVGLILWTFLIIILKAIEYTLIKIEKNTGNGIVGIMGFLLILISFIVKWCSKP